MAATLLSDSTEIEFHQSTRDRWATSLAATIAVAYLLSSLVLVGWFYSVASRPIPAERHLRSVHDCRDSID
jgi:hypothetical protein